jgi:DHA3 family macrolide efflux protein-like MFS transporter
MIKLRAFLFIWAGQVVSMLGSSLSGFCLGIWLYQTTGSASNFALTALCSVLPQMLVSPLAGGLVDRHSRRRMMILGDSGAALCTLGLAALFLSGQIQPWHIFLGTALISACGALQTPAYAALVAGMVQRVQLGRANGLIQFGQGLAEVLAPAIAAALLAVIGVAGVLLVDLATFTVAVTALLLNPIQEMHGQIEGELSQPSHSIPHAVVPAGRVSFWSELREGWMVVQTRPGLGALLRFQMLFSFLWSLFGVLVSPMILGFTDAPGLGLALTAAGGGMLVGSLALSAWGGPRRRLRGLLRFELVSAAAFVLMGARPNLALVAGAAFLAHFTLAFVAGLNQSIWQSQVNTALLGRVLGLRQAAVKGATLLAYLLAGGLADQVLRPVLSPGGALAGSLGSWIGTGPGRGIAALFLLIGLVKAGAALAVSFSPARRDLD